MRLFWYPVPEPLQQPVRACRSHLILAAVFSALINILYLAPTIYMMQVYDRVVPTGGLPTLYWLTLILGFAIGVLAMLDAARVRIMMRASLRLDRMLSPEILERSMLRPNTPTAKLLNAQAMRQFDQLRQTLAGPAVLALFDAPWTPLYLLVAFIIHPVLGAIVMVGGTVLVSLAWANERRNKLSANRAHDATAAAYHSQEATFREAELVRALGMRRSMVARHARERRSGFAATLDLQFSGSRYNSLVKFVRMFMQSLALGVGAFLAVKGEISVGAIIAASVLLSRALQPVEQLVSGWPAIMQAKQGLRTIEALFATTESETQQRTTLPEPEGHIEFDRVLVRTVDGTDIILRNISFTIQPGQVLGVIGPSGAGKTTLARVLAGVVPPDAGEVRLDGANVDDWDPDLLAKRIGYLPQQCGLLPGTVSENISRFALCDDHTRQIVDTEVVRAAKMAGVHDLILRLPRGYDTRVEGNGQPLSAGQTQRVALARALFGNPRLLILDEPNSALDAEGEDALNRAIAAAKLAGTSVLLIAHRASALATADHLLILHDGTVAELGPRNEVLEGLAKRSAQRNVVPMPERA